jgi:predicted TIM-barrel fold metal-dependent hydrolase
MAALTAPSNQLMDTVETLPLVDGHCHCVLDGPVDATGFEQACTEADVPPPAGVSYLDGAAGLAIRRWCAPALDLPSGAPISDYLDRRTELGHDEVTRRLLQSAGLSHLLIDTGLMAGLISPSQLGSLSGAEAREVVRLETVAEQLASEGVGAADFAYAYTGALADATRNAVAVKSIIAYRRGFAIGPLRPSPGEVQQAAGEWLARGGRPRMDHPVLLRFLLWCAVDRGLPVQIHSGFGDRDIRLPEVDPGLLQPFLAASEPSGVPMILLHNYPYQRQAGWLAQVYQHVYLDVGLTIAQVGARADAVLAEFFELAPFGKLLFSTDAYALPELYLVGAAQFRHSLTKLLNGWVADGALPASDAARFASMVGAVNARRLYQL